MATERERKFLVHADRLPKEFTDEAVVSIIEAGYFTDGTNPFAIRVTARDSDTPRAKYKICIKGPGTLERAEFEYSIPRDDARELLHLAPTKLTKNRYDLDGWEIDVFMLEGRQLWIAEWEEAPGKVFPDPVPDWLGVEITEIEQFTNRHLAWQYGRKQK